MTDGPGPLRPDPALLSPETPRLFGRQDGAASRAYLAGLCGDIPSPDSIPSDGERLAYLEGLRAAPPSPLLAPDVIEAHEDGRRAGADTARERTLRASLLGGLLVFVATLATSLLVYVNGGDAVTVLLMQAVFGTFLVLAGTQVAPAVDRWWTGQGR